MPKKSKIAPATRRDWLERYESGERQDETARKDKVNPRTVRDHIERARQERDFELAQREQLREALRAHQNDMLELIGRVRGEVEVLPLDNDSLREARLADEDTRLWRALKEHLGKDRLWRDIADWRRSFLDEGEARADLSRAIAGKAESTFGLPVKGMSGEPRLTPALVRSTRVEVTKRMLGEPASDLASRLRVDGRRLNDPTTTADLAEQVEEPDRIKDRLPKMIDEMLLSPEAEHAARTHRDLQDRSRRVREAAEEYVLLHHIRGRCSLCRKLGGQ